MVKVKTMAKMKYEAEIVAALKDQQRLIALATDQQIEVLYQYLSGIDHKELPLTLQALDRFGGVDFLHASQKRKNQILSQYWNSDHPHPYIGGMLILCAVWYLQLGIQYYRHLRETEYLIGQPIARFHQGFQGLAEALTLSPLPWPFLTNSPFPPDNILSGKQLSEHL